MQQSALGMERTLPVGASLDEAPTTQGECFFNLLRALKIRQRIPLPKS